MKRGVASVDEAIARFDDLVARYEGATPQARASSRRQIARSSRSIARRVATIGMALFGLIVATLAFGLIVGPIGLGGLFLVAVLTLFILIFFSVWPTEKPEQPFSQEMPNRAVVQRLDSYLHRRRAALPAPAARRVDAISAQLPLLESRLGEVDALDPLAQDARRLLGQHLPDLIDHYERVPAAYRHERDSEGLTVDERLAAGLDAASEALDDLGRRMAREDLNAFETQGRFIESRYKEPGSFEGDVPRS
jgi:hypothetical protein